MTMYQSHFGLRESPFNITPNPAFFYSGNARGDILEAMLYAVAQGEGIIKLTGEVGTGKTMLCRMLESRMPPHIDVIYLVNPNLNPLEVQHAIAAELGLPTGGQRADEVQRALHAELIARHSAGRQVVLLVEEAQAMPLDTLEAIRLLTNLETARSKLLQIVLFGQPELDQHLELSSMRQLKERITHSFQVPALQADLTGDFLAFRLRAAGCRPAHRRGLARHRPPHQHPGRQGAAGRVCRRCRDGRRASRPPGHIGIAIRATARPLAAKTCCFDDRINWGHLWARPCSGSIFIR
jgi:type II secretory pathway predicted ATPase ExeA